MSTTPKIMPVKRNRSFWHAEEMVLEFYAFVKSIVPYFQFETTDFEMKIDCYFNDYIIYSVDFKIVCPKIRLRFRWIYARNMIPFQGSGWPHSSPSRNVLFHLIWTSFYFCNHLSEHSSYEHIESFCLSEIYVIHRFYLKHCKCGKFCRDFVNEIIYFSLLLSGDIFLVQR